MISEAFLIAFIVQMAGYMCSLIGLSLWMADAPDIERWGPEWLRRRKFSVQFSAVMAILMFVTITTAIILKIYSI